MDDSKKIVFDSKNPHGEFGYKKPGPEYHIFDIACGLISTTDILFIRENIIVTVEATCGSVAFFDIIATVIEESGYRVDSFHIGKQQLYASTIDAPDSEGRGRYLNIACKVEDDKIILRFPHYDWQDDYPYCDGEYDRWSWSISGYKNEIVFDLKTKTILPR